MSETRKVHLFAVLPALDEPDERSRHSREAVCGRWTATKVATFVGLAYPQHVAARMATPPTWRWLPQESMCAHCARVVPSAVRRDHILSVSLFLAGLSGWLPAAARDLVALVCVDPAAVPVLMDLAEDHASGWARVGVDWPRIERHEHVWIAWERGDEDRAERVSWGEPREAKRCACGVFEHEDESARRETGARGGKSAATRAIVTARVRAGERVMLVRPEGNLVLDLGDVAALELTRRWLEGNV